MSDREITLGADELAAMLEKAVHDGAKRALKEIGLDDAEASGDVRELRVLLDTWRQFKRTAARTFWQVVARWIVSLLIAFLVYVAGWHRLGPMPFWSDLTDNH